jgi:CheY-like chemotaxis protein
MFNPEESLPTSRRNPLLILLAEANPIAQQFALSYLKKAGFQATAVHTGSEILDYLSSAMRNEKPKPALLLLLDDQTPQLSGTECATNLLHAPAVQGLRPRRAHHYFDRHR